ARVRHIEGGEILRRALVRKPDDAPAVFGDLDRHALAHAAEALQLVVREELEIPLDRSCSRTFSHALRSPYSVGCVEFRVEPLNPYARSYAFSQRFTERARRPSIRVNSAKNGNEARTPYRS